MTKGEIWWAKLNEDLKNDPVYMAEGLSMQIALQVNSYIEKSRVSKKELANRLSVTPAYVSQILGGETNLTILTLCKIATALGLRPSIRLEESSYIMPSVEVIAYTMKTAMIFDAAGLSGTYHFCEDPTSSIKEKPPEELKELQIA